MTSLLALSPACNPAPRWVGVASTDPHAITVLNGDLTPKDTLPLPGAPLALRFAPDGASLYVTLGMGADTSMLAQVARTGEPLATSPLVSGAAVDFLPAGPSLALYVAVAGREGGLSLLDPATLTERRRLEVCDTPRGLVTTSDGDRVYVVCGDDRIAEVDTELEIVIRVQSFAEPCDPGRPALSRTESVLFVPCGARSQLWYLDRRTLMPIDSLSVPAGVRSVATTADRRRIVLTAPAESRVLIADPWSRAIVASIETPRNPNGVIVAGNTAYVLAEGGVLAIDPDAGATLAAATLASGGKALAVWPGPRERRPTWRVR